ncbi:MAG TPA: 7-carboxy-7-deazaguanine synthase QueE [Pirellulaceae bacterium]|nr:7-carboxy-7-deazaguanine synthase QueE [Pirellulaceae bacterium]HMP70239.1 7-carboxy-7-deazaguanine synthase QueE [Pirellulaceae bacterium]
MRISEIYCSLQGEGFLTETPSWFIRTSGCNLRCWFCDTPFASWHPEGEQLSHQEILDKLDVHQAQHVVLTGGEPLLPNSVVRLTEQLRERGFHITIETAGTVFKPVACDLISISPKLASSTPLLDRLPIWVDASEHTLSRSELDAWSIRHERLRFRPDVIRNWIAEYTYQIKFVVDDLADCREIEAYLSFFPEIDRRRVLMMPQGIDFAALSEKQTWLEPYCEAHGLRFCPRKQIEWYGNKRGT